MAFLGEMPPTCPVSQSALRRPLTDFLPGAPCSCLSPCRALRRAPHVDAAHQKGRGLPARIAQARAKSLGHERKPRDGAFGGGGARPGQARGAGGEGGSESGGATQN
jgi:hypothetical protein